MGDERSHDTDEQRHSASPGPTSRRVSDLEYAFNVSRTPSISSLSSRGEEDTNAAFQLRRPIRSRRFEQQPKWLKEHPTLDQSRIEAALRDTRLVGVVDWLTGSSPPRKLTIKPIFPRFQSWPQNALAGCLLGRSNGVVAVFLFTCWLVVFSFVLAFSTRQSSALQPIRLACGTRLWSNTTLCGLDGYNCGPFSNASFSFICPSNCASVQVLEPHTVGGEEIIYRSMVIGGPSAVDGGQAIYRGDSFICASAIHAGVIRNNEGGCGTLSRKGEHRHFEASSQHGIRSIAFPATFPLSYTLESTDESCTDPQWSLFTISVLATTLIGLLTESSSIFYTSVFPIIFSQIALASDPPFSPDFASVLSIAFERFLPTMFIAWILYKYCIRHTLLGMEAHVEKIILWLGGCWIGALNNYTFDNIPISRLTPHDLQQQPGAITALVIIVLTITTIAIGQAWAFRIEGRLVTYLSLYISMDLGIACLLVIPSLQLRIHHYILALLLLPGTSLQTRPSLLYQGILLGLFINGTARWGYASILQTAEALRADGQLGSALPQIVEPILQGLNISFALPAAAIGFDGLSVLVNDVERYQGSETVFNWTRTEPDDPAFFRFAYTGTKPLGGTWYGDFTKPGTWYPNDKWVHPLPGPSR